jgi:hypothetical protein
MSTEEFQRLRTHFGQSSTIHQHEAAQMIASPYVTYGAGRRVSLLFERISESVHEGAGRTCAQAIQGFGCYQVSV